MPDAVLSAPARDAGVAFVASVTTCLVAEIQRRHDLWPTASAAVGRLATGAVLFGAGLKGSERVSLQIAGSGPLRTLAADAWLLDPQTIGARGYSQNARVDLPVDARGKFDVAGAVGKGSLQVTRSTEVGQPYVGVVPLHSGEIGEDLALYLAQSEQIPSVVAVGVLANPTGILAAGGLFARVLPGSDERTVVELEKRARALPPVTTSIAEGATAEDLLHQIAGDWVLGSVHRKEVKFACRCNREKVEAVLLGLGADELLELTRRPDGTEAICEYCKGRYTFTTPQVEALRARLVGT